MKRVVVSKDVEQRFGLLEAVKANLLDSVKAILLTAEVSPGEFTDSLVFASRKGSSAIVQCLIETGLDCNVRDVHRNTPLILAAEAGKDEVVTMLISANCDVNRSDSQGRMALHWAAMNGHTSVVQKLLAAEALPDAYDKYYKFTPLMLSARLGHAQIVNMLLKHNASVNKTDKLGETSLFDAARNNNIQCVKLLLAARSNINHIDWGGRTPLMTAVLWNRVEVAALLIYSNCQLENCCPYNILGVQKADYVCTAFEVAIMEGKLKMTNVLILGGCVTNVIHRWLKDHSFIAKLAKNNYDPVEDIVHWLMELCYSIPSLCELTRRCIRQQMGTFIECRIEQLPLPKPLQRYLLRPELIPLIDTTSSAIPKLQ